MNDTGLEGCRESVVPGTKTIDQVDDREELDAESAPLSRAKTSWHKIVRTSGTM